MTQPEQAVGGGSDDTVIAAEPTTEDRLSAAFDDPANEKKPEEGEVSDEAVAAEAEETLTPEDVTEEDEAEGEDAEKPIDPPVSWTAEEKEEFSQLPRELQETLSRREAQREKFVQEKSQEAARSRAEVQQEATAFITGLQNQYAQNIQALLPQIPAMPSNQLQADDPWEYAQQKDAYDYAVAQHQWVQQQLAAIQQQQSLAQQAANQQRLAGIETTLKEQFPEYLDAEKGPKLREQLGSIARELGFTEAELANPDARDILGLRMVATYKAKADKYDALMAKKMEKVREARGLPKVSRPGTARGKGAVANERYQSDRKAMRGGDRDAAVRVFSNL